MIEWVYEASNILLWLLIDEEGRQIAEILYCLFVIGLLVFLLKLRDDK
jgi:hypothetical protein